MSEWTVVTVVIALVGLCVTVTTPVVKLQGAITRLTVLVEDVAKRMDRMEADNTGTHRRLWDRTDQQSRQLAEHEQRITRLEGNSNEG
ncbi:MAG: hypothetical protein ACI4OL_06725 [Gemmiger sp.]